MSNQNALEWIEGTFGLEPNWIKEPDANIISQIARKQLGLSQDTPIEVKYQSKGAFAKLYEITGADRAYSMRISLPVDPTRRTESAVATNEFMKQFTSNPSCRIISYSSGDSDELGFEWVLMEQAPGILLYNAWRKLPWTAKTAIAKQLAIYQAQLFEHKFHKIGNLYRRDNSFVVEQFLSSISYQGDHVTSKIVKGPFTSSHDWLKARLQHILDEQQRIIDRSCDEDEMEDADFVQKLAQQLCELLPTVFMPNASTKEATILVHQSLSMHNIFIDQDEYILKIMDWECAPAVPVWRAYRLPQLFEERERGEKPLKENYAADSDEEDGKDDDGLDNEGTTDLYWEHLLEYELTQLRTIFRLEMEKNSPGWSLLAKQNMLKNDFERAVEDCDNGWRNKSVKRWVDSLAEGEPEDLLAMLFSDPDGEYINQTSMNSQEA